MNSKRSLVRLNNLAASWVASTTSEQIRAHLESDLTARNQPESIRTEFLNFLIISGNYYLPKNFCSFLVNGIVEYYIRLKINYTFRTISLSVDPFPP